MRICNFGAFRELAHMINDDFIIIKSYNGAAFSFFKRILFTLTPQWVVQRQKSSFLRTKILSRRSNVEVLSAKHAEKKSMMVRRRLLVQSGLFAGYCKRKKLDHSASPSSQLMSYLSMCDDYESVGETACLDFWSLNRNKLHLIFPVAMKIFSIPATSAPVERVFSHGGIIMRPHRACMSDTTLADLVFLKCNGLYKKNN